jgi:hypothetical protein
MIKKELKYKVIKNEIPIDEKKPIIKKLKPEIIDLTEVKELFKKPEYAILSKEKFKKKLLDENKAVKIKDIDDFYDKLEVNQLTKQNKKSKFNSVLAYYPGDCYQMDIIVYNKFEYNKYKYILVVIDVYSRFAEVRCLTNRENPNIIKNTLSIFDSMGYPFRLQSDNEFATKEFINIMDKDNVKLSFSDPNEINKNAIVERFNRTLRDLLKRYRLIYGEYNWTKYIDSLVDIYNTSYHKTIKNIPYNIWTNQEFNKQDIIQNASKFKIGDKVRIVKVKELFGKADEVIHSKEIYTVKNINKNKIFLDNGKSYKSYELIKVNDIIYLVDNIDKHEEIAHQIFQKEQKQNRKLKKDNMENTNIIMDNTKRERKPVIKLNL